MSSREQTLGSNSSTLQSRLMVSANGSPLSVPHKLQIRQSRLAEAGTFSFVIPVVDVGPHWFDPGVSTSGKSMDVEIDIYAGFLPNGSPEGTSSMSSIFTGVVDHVNYRPLEQTVTVSGRDWSAKLIEYELAGNSFLNSTASAAIAELASRVGLSADVDATSGLVGQFYQYEHKAHGLAGMHRFQTAWDFCVGMQRRYGYDLWVDGKTLHFKEGSSSSNPITLDWKQRDADTAYPQSSIWNLSLSRRLTYSDNVAITVSAWDARQRTVHKATHPRTLTGLEMSYSHTAAVGTTQDECAALALQRYNETVSHARTLTMNVHPSLQIAPRQRVMIQGTGSTFDGIVYTVDEVMYSVSGSHVSQTVTLRKRDSGVTA